MPEFKVDVLYKCLNADDIHDAAHQAFVTLATDNTYEISLAEIGSDGERKPAVRMCRLIASDYSVGAKIPQSYGDLDYDITASFTVQGEDAKAAALNAFAAMSEEGFQIKVWERGSGATGIKPAEVFTRGEVFAEA